MKTLLAALLFASTAVRADLVIVQKVDGGGQSGEQTIRIKGNQMRADVSPLVSMISDGASGASVTLMHAAKTYRKISAAETLEMVEKMKKLRSGGEPAKLTSTGKMEKIGAHNCEIFTTNFGGMIVTYWIAKDFSNFREVLSQMEKPQAGIISAMNAGLLPAVKEFPGMPVKTEMDMGGTKVSTLLISVKEEKVDPASFEIPAGYTEVIAPEPGFPK